VEPVEECVDPVAFVEPLGGTESVPRAMCVEPDDVDGAPEPPPAAGEVPSGPFGFSGPPPLARVVGLTGGTRRRVTLSLGIARSA